MASSQALALPLTAQSGHEGGGKRATHGRRGSVHGGLQDERRRLRRGIGIDRQQGTDLNLRRVERVPARVDEVKVPAGTEMVSQPGDDLVEVQTAIADSTRTSKSADMSTSARLPGFCTNEKP